MSKLVTVLPFVLAISGSLLYHTAAKSIPKAFDPAAALIGLYATALAGSIVVHACLRSGSVPLQLSRLWHPTIAAVGIGALLIELGFLVAYRAGWPVSLVSVVTNGMVAMLLVPIGVLAFREPFTAARMLGVLLILAGVSLLQR